MTAKKTETTKKDLNKQLAEKYGLQVEDFWKTKDKWVIKSAALRNVAAKENLTWSICSVQMHVLNQNPYFVTVARATYTEGERVWSYDSLGSAHIGNCGSTIAMSYLAEMSEKRGVDRAIIQALRGIGVIDSDQLYSDSEASFDQPKRTIMPTVTNAVITDKPKGE